MSLKVPSVPGIYRWIWWILVYLVDPGGSGESKCPRRTLASLEDPSVPDVTWFPWWIFVFLMDSGVRCKLLAQKNSVVPGGSKCPRRTPMSLVEHFVHGGIQ